jgi:histidine decarboxylase
MAKARETSGDDIPYGPDRRPWSAQVPNGAVVSGPKDDPAQIYSTTPPANVHDQRRLPSVDPSDFQLPPERLTDAQRVTAYATLVDVLGTQHARFTGFQANQDQSYSPRLSWLLDMHVNNLGDPFQPGDFTLSSKFCERNVLDHFAALWNNEWPNRYDVLNLRGQHPRRLFPERYWGYVLSMGCTEANIYGLWNGRDYLKGRQLIEEPPERGRPGVFQVDPAAEDNPHAYRPIIFYSEDTHYSVIKAVRILELTTFYEEGQRRYPGQCPITTNGAWPTEVPSHDDPNAPDSGTVRLADLERLVRFFVERGYPPLIVANIGTTWKGAYDDVAAINEMLERLGQEFPWLWERTVHYDKDQTDVRRGFWLHVDAALGGPFLPFVEMAYNRGLLPERGPNFDFRLPAVMSIGCSMHKWIGGPFPSGVYMTRTKFQLEPPEVVGLLGALDTTLGGSRSGFSPLIFWDYFSRMGYEDNMQKALETVAVAAYLETRLRDLEARLQQKFGREVDLWIERSRLSLAVRFREPNPTLTYKWTIDTDTLDVPISKTEQQQRAYGHQYVMHAYTRERVDAFIEDLWRASHRDWHDAFPEVIAGTPNPGPITPIQAPLEGALNHRVFVPVRGRGWS